MSRSSSLWGTYCASGSALAGSQGAWAPLMYLHLPTLTEGKSLSSWNWLPQLEREVADRQDVHFPNSLTKEPPSRRSCLGSLVQ